jgi:hypothetical protein
MSRQVLALSSWVVGVMATPLVDRDREADPFRRVGHLLGTKPGQFLERSPDLQELWCAILGLNQ